MMRETSIGLVGVFACYSNLLGSALTYRLFNIFKHCYMVTCVVCVYVVLGETLDRSKQDGYQVSYC